MKKLIFALVFMAASQGFAIDYQDRAEDLFNQQTPAEAMQYGWTLSASNINIPTTSSYFDGLSELCVNGANVQTVHPQQECVLWAAKGDDDDNWETKYFESKFRAEDFDDHPTCVQKSAPVIISHPINYTAEACVLWTAKGGDDDNWERKYFKRRLDAKDYADNYSCAKKALVKKSIPTTYTVKFYRNEREDDNYLGQHTYPLRSCGGLDPVPAY